MVKNRRELLAGYVDGELSDEDKQAFEAELAADAELREELEEFRKLQEVTGMVQYADLPDEVWDNYWHSIYRKTERGFGWILLSLGAIVLLCFGLYEAMGELYTDPEAPLWLKVGLTAGGVGFIFLLVSYARERLFAYNRDRYKEVTK
ncbi:MAG: zf-HC2 domain-containing protein [candidate division Zixibacteria bacterium]|nr:zf-HC2 domain-containing protein [candidate division Zixibacteria bacterium]MDH3936931.1 zf-HC2 domain-containing protein [candidate division Zixibacteria bacterium]MDH4032764.1 zf-HC2 domain-containing protein [candidate division Zixibacteria bacterium]